MLKLPLLFIIFSVRGPPARELRVVRKAKQPVTCSQVTKESRELIGVRLVHQVN